MKKSILSVVFLISAIALYAQGKYEVIKSDYSNLEITFSAPDHFSVENITLKGQDFVSLAMDGFDQSSAIGCPSLPTLREMIEIPICGGISVQVKSERHILVDGESMGITDKVAPLQPSVCKTASRNSNILAYDYKTYTTNAFYGLEPVTVETVGVARDRNLAQVVFSPVKYNPITNQFVIYTAVEAVLTYRNPNIVATRDMKQLHYSPVFGNGIQTINTLDAVNTKSTTNAPMRYLIVANAMFREKLVDFVDWKKRTGFIVDVVYTDDAAVGTTQTSIKNYIKSQYTNATETNPAPTFLLLVGDVEQLPAKTYSHGDDEHVSDLDYACWTDGDEIPDCYYGRFSAQNIGQLTPQIQKTLLYERYEFPDDLFLGNALLVAGVDGGNDGDLGYTHADPTMDYLAKLYINGNNKTVLRDTSLYSYASVVEYKNNPSINPNATNVTVVNNSQDVDFRSRCSQGAGYINYTAHGYAQGWADPGLSNSDVSSMTNMKKYGVMIGNCCQSGKFDESICFGEALLRKSGYCGAVGYIGGSNYTYWGEDFYWAVGQRNTISATMNLGYIITKKGAYDHMFHTHSEAYSEWATTMGSIVMNGNMAVQGSNSGLKDYYWQIYHVFGDPSLMPWLSQAKEMPFTYSGATAGSTHLTVNAVPYAYVAVTTEDNTLLGAAFADQSGVATIDCSEPLEFETYVIAATAQNYKPVLATVSVTNNGISESENIANGGVKLYPNPTSGRIMVDADGLQKVEVVDAVGRVLVSQTDGNVDMSRFARGVYTVRVMASGIVTVKKVMKQ